MPAPPRPSAAVTITAGLPDLMTPGEVGRLLRLDPKTLSNRAYDSALRPFRTPGGHRRYRRGAVTAFIGRHAQERAR